MNSDARANRHIPEIEIDVVEPDHCARRGRIPLHLWRDINFSTECLESYAFASWQPVLHDAMVLAATVEFADTIIKRPLSGWARRITIRIPVHNTEQWKTPSVAVALQDAIEFLTGDHWAFEFVQLSGTAPSPRQDYLFRLPVKTKAILPYSDGMDSRAVAGILSKSHGEGFVRVRIGSKNWDRVFGVAGREPFTSVPYNVSCKRRNKESTARSRGFKFALISCVAAYLTDAQEIMIPESGQGAIGPAILHLGHIYPDFRNHPLFAIRMAKFINALLGTQIRFIFPRIWSTKGETLREFVTACEGGDWVTTRSCWRGNNWCSMNGRLCQCGVCAACMLRRVSVHAAGLTEKPEVYVANDMSAKTLEEAVDNKFTKLNTAFREYAIAGVLHMDHLADMAEADALPIVKRHATLIAPALHLSVEDAERELSSLLDRHAEEWRNYLDSLGPHSFVKQWVRSSQ